MNFIKSLDELELNTDVPNPGHIQASVRTGLTHV